MYLENEMEALKNKIPHYKIINTKVSSTGIDWHLDHSLKVIITVCTALQNSNPEDYTWKFNFTKLLIFTARTIPKGKAKAPKSVIATGAIDDDLLNNEFNDAIKLLKIIKNLPKKSNFKHPIFGILNRNETVKFLKIHTNHHLKIMADIKAKS